MIRLTITVSNMDIVITLFDSIYVYTSTEESGDYTLLGTLSLTASRSVYEYSHLAGTPDTWYKSRLYNTSNGLTGSWSEAVQGNLPTLYHDATYPPEFEFGWEEQIIVRKIRRYVGDLKGLRRLYYDNGELCSPVLEDNKTIMLEERGWPVYISIAEVESTTLSDPVIQGYLHLTFSGTIGSTDVIDVWYNTFKFSDVEIYQAYTDTMMPPFLTSSTVTQDHLLLQASIDLLENMTSADMVDDGARVVDERSTYDPSPGLAERDKTIERLRKMLDALVRQYMLTDITGVLID